MGVCLWLPYWWKIGSLERHPGGFGPSKSQRLRYPYRICIQNIGALAGYPFAPYLSDGLGRRNTILIGAVIMCIATAVQTAAQSVGMFIGAR
jgi:MFS family permease